VLGQEPGVFAAFGCDGPAWHRETRIKCGELEKVRGRRDQLYAERRVVDRVNASVDAEAPLCFFESGSAPFAFFAQRRFESHESRSIETRVLSFEHSL
jgi:hypothetical protein